MVILYSHIMEKIDKEEEAATYFLQRKLVEHGMGLLTFPVMSIQVIGNRNHRYPQMEKHFISHRIVTWEWGV